MGSGLPGQPIFVGGKRRRRLSAPAIAVSVLVLAFVGLLIYGVTSSGTEDSIDQLLEDGKAASAPGFELPVLSGGNPGRSGDATLQNALADDRLDLGELRGSPVVLNFWASWCPPCLEEAPVLERAWRSFRDRGVIVVGLNMQDVTDDARGFLRDQAVTYPNVRDRSDGVAREWGVAALPESYFIDRRGKVVGHVIGALSQEQLEEGVRASIAGRPLGSRAGGDQRPTR